ncbi:polysaccharide deacetylase family protein [Desulfitobacterium sp. PCE1]|uniref:polysaccharide deacetylase family protein n=1 Tax=Desulfitobacterium sp. PCE1 TaxID=146907 RepID=UPI00037FDED4|nr:polysaccharide deacetylase family protein [Desulfitobacterium sp. PCE1]
MYVFKVPFKTLKLLGLVLVLALGILIEQRVVVIVAHLPTPIDQVKTEKKVMALTINVDWGGEFLPGILDALDKYNGKATFFLTGRWAQNNPEMVKEIQARGHAIENHGYSHPHPDQISISANQEEILKTEKIVQEITGTKTKYYAPPYGEKGASGLKAAENLGYTTILWTLDTVDWRPESTPEIITKRIVDPAVRFGIKPTREGAIVLMHPKENTVKALPNILSRLANEGFQFITVNELITLEGVGDTTS